LKDAQTRAGRSDKFGNNLGTITAEYQLKPCTTVQEEQRRVNKIDNRREIDTVEVIGSIPVAPIDLEVVSSALLLSFFVGCR
jgi:hypothetical protein